MFEHGPRIHYVKVPVAGINKPQPVMCIAVRGVWRSDSGVVQVGISVRAPNEKTWNKKLMRKIAMGRCRSGRISMRKVVYDLHNLGLDTLGNRNIHARIIDFLAPFVGPLEYVPRLKREARLMRLASLVSLEHYVNTIGGST